MIDLHELINELEDLWVKHMPSYSMKREELRTLLVKHYSYGTLDWVRKDGKIIGAVRYNINKKTAHIIDLVIDENKNGYKMMKLLIARGWSRFPHAINLEFERGFKYRGREMKRYKLRDFFKRKRS